MIPDNECKICGEEMFKGENCFVDKRNGKHICCNCFEQLSNNERIGIVPCTRTMTTEWKSYVRKFGLET